MSLNPNLMLEVPGKDNVMGLRNLEKCLKQQSISSGVQEHRSETTNLKHFTVTGNCVLSDNAGEGSSSRGKSC